MISPESGITNPTIEAMSRNPSSVRYSDWRTSSLTPRPDRRDATHRDVITTTGQPRPSSSRLEPVMLAAAYCT